MKIPILILLLTLLLCACMADKNQKPAIEEPFTAMHRLYSEAVKDSFNISVHLPKDYYKNPDKKYPAVYVLDANFYFPMLAEVVKQYETAGLLPPLVLVGIGYQSFAVMDSLRERDYLYPAALPSDEMKTTGGGKNFNSFITGQLLPYIDARYCTASDNRTLLGHSFGGYFSLYALLNQVTDNQTAFDNIISASPSLWYNNFYLNQIPAAVRNRKTGNQLNIYLSAGGLEDPKWNINPVKKLAGDIAALNASKLSVHYSIFNDLDHMDVAMISFTRALQIFYKQTDN